MTEEELVEFLLAFLPESFGGWLGAGMAISAILSLILPKPAENSHPAWKICHRAICVFGLGAGKLKAAGRLAKAGTLIRGAKK